VQPDSNTIPSKIRILSLWLIAMAAIILIADLTHAAGEKKTAGPQNEDEDQPILIKADQLISNSKEKFAEFIGNVIANQADFVITCDKLRIYYQGDLIDTEGTSNKEEKNSNDDGKLKKIVATGRVKIDSSQYNAKSERVEYDTESMIITLTGDDSTVTSGKNSIVGSKIILYRKDGRVKVIGSKKKRVEATFYSGGKASDAFKVEGTKE
jgi:lipopolysaccharide export system protein LptA